MWIDLTQEFCFQLIIFQDTIAFGGRVVRDGKFAKYINSPETEFYKKEYDF